MTNPTRSERAAFGISFVTSARNWRRAVADALAGSGLTDATWAPLVRLDQDGDGITQTELASRLSADTSGLVRLLDLLEARGLIARRVCPQDRRARLISLTPSGRREVGVIRGRIALIEDQLLAGFSDEEITLLNGFFARISVRIAGEDN